MRKRRKRQAGYLVRIEAPADDRRPFGTPIIRIKFGKILRNEVVAYTHHGCMFQLLQFALQGEECTELPYSGRGMFIKEALPLGNEISYVGGVLRVVPVPPSGEELPVLLYRATGNQYHDLIMGNQIFSPNGL